MNKVMFSVEEASRRIASGRTLLIAGDEALLRRLPVGNWIGGTTAYFIAEDGGLTTEELLLVTELPEFVAPHSTVFYDHERLSSIPADAAPHGVSFVIIPFGSPAHQGFAVEAPEYPNLHSTPLVGWVAGASLEKLGPGKAWVFDGRTGEASNSRAVVLHAQIPESKAAIVEIYNIFEPADGDEVRFEETGMAATHCFINKQRTSLAGYMRENGLDITTPLVANYSGAMLNTSFWQVDEKTGIVHFARPVFEDVVYRFAKPVADYSAEFDRVVPPDAKPVFSCNCVANYMNGKLQGRKTGALTGPIVFGEIAYHLLNQTCVSLSFRDL